MGGVTIKDSIHGDIQLDSFERELADSPQFQRLRRVRQLALAYLVYPGANHSRFEHCVGTMHLTGVMCSHLKLGRDDTEKLRAAALLHDVGHVAFSHEGEAALEHQAGSHEELGEKVLANSELGDVLRQKFSVKEIAGFYKGSELGQLIASDLGSDRMDYLNRDSHYTGVAYGVVDSGRLIHTLEFSGGRLLLEKGGLEAAEALLIARFLMFSTVYMHKTVRIASAMLQEAIRLSLSSRDISVAEAVGFGDSEMLLALKRNKEGAELVKRIEQRRLYKFAYAGELPGAHELEKLKSAIAAAAGASPHEVVFESSFRPTKKFGIRVITNSGEKGIEELSDLASSIIKAEEKRRKLLVAAPLEKVEEVRRACEKEFGS